MFLEKNSDHLKINLPIHTYFNFPTEKVNTKPVCVAYLIYYIIYSSGNVNSVQLIVNSLVNAYPLTLIEQKPLLI